MSASTHHRDELCQLVSFILEEEEFGINILKVREIIRPIEVTRVPNAPPFVEGVVNLRGQIVPVIDLRKRFGLPERGQDKNTRIVVVEIADMVTGFLVDAVQEVLRVNTELIEPPPDLAVGVDVHYIRGVAKLDDRLLILLDLEEILSEEEVDAMENSAMAA